MTDKDDKKLGLKLTREYEENIQNGIWNEHIQSTLPLTSQRFTHPETQDYKWISHDENSLDILARYFFDSLPNFGLGEDIHALRSRHVTWVREKGKSSNIDNQAKYQAPLTSQTFVPGFDINSMGYRWTPQETRRAMNLYFEKFLPKLVEQGFVNDAIELKKQRVEWKDEN